MKYLVLPILFSSLCYSQKTEYYKYGYEGIEMFHKGKDSTVIYTQHLAKATIRTDVALIVLNLYLKRKLKDGNLVVELPNAIVTGRIKIEKRERLVVINYYYQKVEWCDKYLIEIPENLKPIKKKNNVHTNKRR